jgi:hypothetical protein
MLTERAVAYLQPLRFSNSAERKTCLIPLGGIYWEDEFPDFREMMDLPEVDRSGIYRLLALRFKIWKGVELEGADREFWDAARAQVPEYALFSRLKLSDEDRAAQEAIEAELEEAFELLFANADEVTITEKGGFQSYSATFDLTKERGAVAHKRPWWKRLFRL